MSSAACSNCVRLARPRISVAAGVSAVTGYIVAAWTPGPRMFLAGFGVFLLSCGASALNQYQERAVDGLMERTKNRPLPAGTLTNGAALLFAAGTAAGGLVLMALAGGAAGVLLGLFALAWYNGLYTKLKQLTAFAAVPGALVGAVPPVIGWQAAGGGFSDPALLVLCLFFFIWQVPHFWLAAAGLAAEHRRAGLPAVTEVFSEKQLSRVLFIWIMATAVSALLFIPFGLTLHQASRYLLAAFSLGLALAAVSLLRMPSGGRTYARTFAGINMYMFSVTALLFADRVA